MSDTGELKSALADYRNGVPRTRVFCNLVLRSVEALNGRSERRVLDIGCGHGFCSDSNLQRTIAERATNMIGVEPDPSITPPDYFHTTIRTTFEEAAIPKESVDVAYSCFVLEHLSDPVAYWQKVHECLVPGGVAWGFTVDARHPFSLCSRGLERVHLKDWYLNRIQGTRGTGRYENYPVWYRTNSPRAIRRHANAFSNVECLSLHRPGQMDFYFPRVLRPFVRTFERCSIALGLPGSVLIVRAQK